MRHRWRGQPFNSKVVGVEQYRELGPPWTISPPSYHWLLRATLPDAPAVYFSEHCYDSVNSGPPYLTGGPFNKWDFQNGAWQESRESLIKATYTPTSPDREYSYTGVFTPGWFPPSGWTSTVNLPYLCTETGLGNSDGTNTWGDPSSYGATAWKRYRPGRSGADLGVFLGEAKDIPRMLRTTAKGFSDAYRRQFGRSPKASAKKAADHWLNTQFGWLPFLSDMRKFYKTWHTSDKMLKQLVKDNGQWIKRGGTIVTDESQSLYSSNDKTCNHRPALQALYFVGNKSNAGTSRITLVQRSKVWFEARFRYYIPDIQDVIWSKRALAHLYGLDVNPCLLWELTPWSWLVDWFSNVGDVISNLDTGFITNLAAKYAYVMGTTEKCYRVTSTANFLQGPHTVTWDFSLMRKARVAANPFGFNLTWSALTPRQWSILSALGISRLH